MAVILPPLATDAENTTNASSDASDVKRVTDLWFEDGSLVIRAGRKEFRVFRSVLTSKSSVFRDMASFTSPSRPGVEDCASTVVLQDDPDEVEAFLRAIFDSSYFELYPVDVASFALIGIARLSHKYNVPYLRRRAFTHLNAITNLQDMKSNVTTIGRNAAAEQFFHDFQLPTSDQNHKPSRLKINGQFSHSLIQLAREINAPWLLPWTYFVAGSLRRVEITLKSSLSFVDKALVLYCQGLFKDLVIDMAMAIDLKPETVEECVGGRFCEAAKSKFRKVTLEGAKSRATPFNALNLGWHYTNVKKLGNVCSACLKEFQGVLADELETWWKSLPSKCNLGEWESLMEVMDRETKEP